MAPQRNQVIAYYRVSTDKQGRSGLGLEGQQAAVASYIASNGGYLVQGYTEVETAAEDDMAGRPQLLRALAHARRSKATLVIAKLDRLARSVFVTATLHKAGVDFVCCDNPTANKLTIQILAVIAENEAKVISERTKAALAAYKARGGILGATRPECRNLTPEAREKGRQAASIARRKQASEAYADILPEMQAMRAEGKTLWAIADWLNGEGYATRNGKQWSQVQVGRVLGMA